MTRRISTVLPVLALLLALSCGDDEGGPAGPGEDPAASTLSAVPSTSQNSISLSWTPCADADFSEYRLYRSPSAGIADDPASATLVSVFDSALDTLWIDQDLDWGETYYYALQTRDTESLSAWSNEDHATTPDSGGSGYLSCHDIQGEQSSSPYEGQVVTVSGIVTVGGAEYYTSTSPYAVIGDAEGGAWSGLVLYGDSIGTLERGQLVAITGTVQEYYGMTELGYITGVQVLSTGEQLPPASPVQTSWLTDAGGAEQWEAVLVEISDAIVTAVGSYGQFSVDDGSGECFVDDLGSYSYSPAVGDTLNAAAGVCWYSYSEWKLEPRDDEDLDVGGGGGPTDVLTCYQVQGQASSSPYVDEVVSVTGIVTVAGGEFYSSSQAYAVIQDATGGPWSGLILYDSDISSLSRGDSVTVTGTVAEYYGLTELSYISDVVVHSAGHALPAAEIVTTGSLATPADPEQWESVLLRVQDLTVVSDSLGFGEWSVTDGTGACRVDDLGDYAYTPTVGDAISSITGALYYGYSDFKLEPRDDADIVR